MLDKNKRYTVSGYRGIAFYFFGYPKVWEVATFLATDEDGNEYEAPSDDGEWIEDCTGRVVMIMVGDDHKFTVDESDCTEISEDDYCHECGQIGCTADGRDRDEATT